MSTYDLDVSLYLIFELMIQLPLYQSKYLDLKMTLEKLFTKA